MGHLAKREIQSEVAVEVIRNRPADLPPVEIRHGEERIKQVGETKAGAS